MENYFRYLPETGLADRWGLEVTAAGYTRISPGDTYPPARHPADHHFAFEQGRILHAYQLIFVSDGRGVFESDATSPDRLTLGAGQVLLLLPDVWHRYAPDRTTGWVEHWIECTGPTLARMQRDGLLDERRPIISPQDVEHLHQCFMTIHYWAAHVSRPRRVELASLAAHVFTLARIGAPIIPQQYHPIDQAVREAQLLIAERLRQPLNTEAIARELGVAYSYFRKVFQQRVGVPPKRYQIQLRLRRAKQLLANTRRSITEVADELGFDTPYHLSQQFKRHFGVSPSLWRRTRRLGHAKPPVSESRWR